MQMLAMDWMSLEASHAQGILDIEGNIEMANARKDSMGER